MANEVREPLKLYFHENTAEQSSMLNTIVTNVLNNMGITSIQAEVVENAVADYLTENPIKDGVTPNIAATAIVGELTGTPTVDVTQSGTKENPILNFEFNGLKGEKGGKGDTGATPTVTASATVNQTTGTPSVNVSKSGTDENPNFNFDFSGIKGNKGDKGNTGATPSISVLASADNTIGTPTVNVSKSGTDENPSFSFAFSGIKGEKGNKGDKGDDGLDGFSSRLPQAEYNPSDYLVVDDGTTAKKISVDTFALSKNDISGIGDLLKWSTTAQIAQMNGITFTKNEDRSVTVQGTLSGDYAYWICEEFSPKENEQYTIKQNITNYSISFARITIIFIFVNASNEVISRSNVRSDEIEKAIDIPSGTAQVRIQYWVASALSGYELNETIDISIYKSDIIDASDNETVATNKKLTNRVAALENKDYLTTPQVVNRDANMMHDGNLGMYADALSFDSPNLPYNSNTDIITFQRSTNNYSQIALSKTADGGKMFYRTMSGGTWGAWKRLITEDDLATLSARITALENK